MIWCLFRGLVLLLRSSLDWLNQEDATASVWKGCFNVSPRSSLLAHQEGPFSGCYWVTSLEWPRIEWHSWRNYTNKQVKLKWTAAPFNNFFKYWREYKKIENHPCVQCLLMSNACSNNNNSTTTTLFVPSCTLHWFTCTQKLDKYIERVQAAHNNPYLPTSGDLNSGDSLFCTTPSPPHPRMSTAPTPQLPPRANKLP